jgi:hypothetical protein
MNELFDVLGNFPSWARHQSDVTMLRLLLRLIDEFDRRGTVIPSEVRRFARDVRVPVAAGRDDFLSRSPLARSFRSPA